MLKTSLLICFRSHGDKLRQLSLNAEEHAYLLLYHLSVGLYLFGVIPNMFAHGGDELFHCRHPLDITQENEGRCCVERKNLLLITSFLRLTVEPSITPQRQRLLTSIARDVPSRNSLKSVPEY